MRLPLFAIALVGCSEPDLDSFFVQMDVRVATEPAQAAAEFVSVIESAEDTLLMAMPQSADPTIAEALVAAHDNGRFVEVVTDIDNADDAGFQLLVDAGIPVREADDAVTYFDFIVNDLVRWSSDQVQMSHAFLIADDRSIVNATAVGGTDSSTQIIFQAASEDLADDLKLEHNQLMGGSDATALTAFSAPAKSRADIRTHYPTQTDSVYELWLGPQERVTKRIIDAVYSARRSIRVMTNELANDGLALALQDKAAYGFDVQVIVGPQFGTTNSALTRRVQDSLVNADTFQYVDGDLPTIVLIDIEGKDGTLDVYPRAFVLSHDLYSAGRFFANAGGQLTEVTTDQLIDGNLNVINDENYRLGEDGDSLLQPIVDVYLDHLDRSGDF